MNNYEIGNSFEQSFAEFLASKGYWVHRLARGKSGEQPADIIAVYHGRAYLIDCKAVTTDRGYNFSRIEENQDSAMRMWEKKGNGQGWFALQLDNEVYMLTLSYFRWYAKATNKKTMSPEDIRVYGINVNEWIEL